MKYLFAAIDARQGRVKINHRSGITRPKFNAPELKKLLVDASEGVDEKSSSNDFVDTLERIVNEIKNTSEHSGAFLQKVKKTEVPDYYDVIKKPMDLATLLKRVKGQMYRNKKAFADDLDLIWSNCLSYNSHPSHPLRRSAEALRVKSNQLLQFISDPSVPTRSVYAASTAVSKANTPNLGGGGAGTDDMDVDTPAGEDEGRGGEGESEDDGNGIGGIKREGGRFVSRLSGINNKLLNGVNGDRRDRSESPMSGTATPVPRGSTPLRKALRGPLGRRSRSPSTSNELAFEDRPAIIRTPESMQIFSQLDEQLFQIDNLLSWNSKDVNLLPPIASTSNVSSTSGSDPSITTTTLNTPLTDEQIQLYNLIKSLTSLPTPPSAPSTVSEEDSTPALISTPVALTSTSSTIIEATKPDQIWWDTVACTSSSSALASGLPSCGFLNLSMVSNSGNQGKVLGKGKGKGRNLVNGKKFSSTSSASALASTSTSTLRQKNRQSELKSELEGGLSIKMNKNLETLRKIRRLHSKISNSKLPFDSSLEFTRIEDDLSESDEDILLSDDDKISAGGKKGKGKVKGKGKRVSFKNEMLQGEGVRRRKGSMIDSQGARDSMGVVSHRILGHAGFDASNSTALNVLSDIGAEYMMNLGRTLRFYSDAYGSKLSTEQILLHVLNENGIPSPSSLGNYIHEDIEKYGTRLNALEKLLVKTRTEQVAEIGVEEDASFFTEDSQVLISGEISKQTGEDFFSITSTGLDRDLGITSLSIPPKLFRGETSSSTHTSYQNSEVRYPPPPPFVPLDSSSIELQIGLLQGLYRLREKTEFGLTDDNLLENVHRITRPKVPGTTGRVPPRKRIEENTGGKTKRKNKIVVTAESEG